MLTLSHSSIRTFQTESVPAERRIEFRQIYFLKNKTKHQKPSNTL